MDSLSQEELIKELEKKANLLRQDVIRMTYLAGSGHPGGSLSAADMIAALYFHVLRIDPSHPHWEDRDRFILSKGHCCPVLYAALARVGFFPWDSLATLRQLHSILQGHPDMKKTRGVDMTSGSLGHGLAAGVGMALGARLDGKSYRVFVMLGDGEVQEGVVWEAAMAASHYHLDDITAIVDYNGLQVDGFVRNIMSIEPLADKWRAFGWHVITIDGHCMREILGAFEEAGKVSEKPSVVIARTIKGKGVSFMENKVQWHGTAPNAKQMEEALRELSCERESAV